METKIGRAEVPGKKIADLDFGDLDLKAETPEGAKAEAAIQPNSLNFRLEPPHRKRKKRWDGSRIVKYLAVVLLLLFSLSLALRFVDELREPAIGELKALAASVKKKKAGKVLVPILSKMSLVLKAHRPVQPIAAPETDVIVQGTCAAFITDAINKRLKSKLSSAEFLHVVNCELFQDSAVIAQQSLQKAGITLAKGVSWDKLPESLLALEATRKLQPLNPMPLFPKQGCLRFAPTPDCVMRYIDEARMSSKSRWQDAFKILEPELLERSASENIWFYLASSHYAQKDGDFTKADSYAKKSFEFLEGQKDPYLEREVYRNATISAFLSGNPAFMKNAKTYRPIARAAEDPRAFMDVDLLEKLPSPKGRELIKDFLSSSEAKTRYTSDVRFLNIVFRDTQTYGLQNEGLDFARSLFGTAPKADNFGESLLLIYARLMIGASKGSDAVALLDSLESAGYRSAELYHLRGLAYLLPSSVKSSQLMAAKDFQTAAGMSKNEESLFAMFVALLGSSNQSKAEQVLTQWKSLGATAQKSGWFAFAEGIQLHNAGKKAEAEAAWGRGEKMSKNKEMWRVLKSNVEKDPTYFERDVPASLKFIMPPDSPLGSLALYGQKS